MPNTIENKVFPGYITCARFFLEALGEYRSDPSPSTSSVDEPSDVKPEIAKPAASIEKNESQPTKAVREFELDSRANESAAFVLKADIRRLVACRSVCGDGDRCVYSK